MSLFHYTTEKRLTNILDSGIFFLSEDIQTDSVYGVGWYFTGLPPNTCEKKLMRYCWNKVTLFMRIKFFMELEVINGQAFRKRNHVYFVPKNPSVSFRILKSGPTPECSLKPCHSCIINPDK